MRWDRAGWVAFGVLTLAVAALFLRSGGPTGMPWLPGCLFHDFTGLDCPGCGMTRAAHATLHGNIAEAVRFNPLGMILLPVAAVGLGIEMLGWIRGKPLPFRFQVGAAGAWAIAGVLIGFWILRNIPVWPLTLLAPP